MSTLYAWTCVDHDGYWSVPVASVVLAEDVEEAGMLLRIALRDAGVDPNEPFTLQPLDLTMAGALVLSNGNY